MKSLGIIVKREWVDYCYSLKKRVPWRRCALDDAESKKKDSDDEEILDESYKRKNSPEKDEAASLYDQDTARNSNVLSSGEDTDDDLERARKRVKPKDVNVVISDDGEPPRQKESSRKKDSPRKKTSPKKKETHKKSVIISSDEEVDKAAVKDDFDVTTDEEEFTIARRAMISDKKA